MARLIPIRKKTSMDLFEGKRPAKADGSVEMQAVMTDVMKTLGGLSRKIKISRDGEFKLAYDWSGASYDEDSAFRSLSADPVARSYWSAYSMWVQSDNAVKYYISKPFFNALSQTKGTFHRQTFGTESQSYCFILPEKTVIDKEGTEYGNCFVWVNPAGASTGITISLDSVEGNLIIHSVQVRFCEGETLDDALDNLRERIDSGDAPTFELPPGVVPETRADGSPVYQCNMGDMGITDALRAIFNAVVYIKSPSSDLKVLRPVPTLNKTEKKRIAAEDNSYWNSDTHTAVLLNWEFKEPKEFKGRKGHYWWKPCGPKKSLRVWDWRRGSGEKVDEAD